MRRRCFSGPPPCFCTFCCPHLARPDAAAACPSAAGGFPVTTRQHETCAGYYSVCREGGQMHLAGSQHRATSWSPGLSRAASRRRCTLELRRSFVRQHAKIGCRQLSGSAIGSYISSCHSCPKRAVAVRSTSHRPSLRARASELSSRLATGMYATCQRRHVCSPRSSGSQ